MQYGHNHCTKAIQKRTIFARPCYDIFRKGNNESGLPEFTGIVSEAKGIAYAVTFEYGRGRCMSYQFKYGNVKNGS